MKLSSKTPEPYLAPNMDIVKAKTNVNVAAWNFKRESKNLMDLNSEKMNHFDYSNN